MQLDIVLGMGLVVVVYPVEMLRIGPRRDLVVFAAVVADLVETIGIELRRGLAALRTLVGRPGIVHRTDLLVAAVELDIGLRRDLAVLMVVAVLVERTDIELRMDLLVAADRLGTALHKDPVVVAVALDIVPEMN